MRLLVVPAWNRCAKCYHKQRRKLIAEYHSHHTLVDTDAIPLTRDLTNPTEGAVSFIGNRTD